MNELPISNELHAKAVAYLSAQGLPQDQIAATLGVSQPKVSRLLRAARANRWLVTRCELSTEDVELVQQSLYRELPRLRDFIKRISDSSGLRHPRGVNVFEVDPNYRTTGLDRGCCCEC